MWSDRIDSTIVSGQYTYRARNVSRETIGASLPASSTVEGDPEEGLE